MIISGLGPHGERAAPPERVTLLPEDRAAAKARGYRIAVVMHKLESAWASQQLLGMVGQFGGCGAAVTHVIDCACSPAAQVAALVGFHGYATDFFATNKSERAFTKRMRTHRPDITIRQDGFGRIDQASGRTEAMLAQHPDLAGLFVVWDTPALKAAKVLRRQSKPIPVATVDLGAQVAIGLAQGGPFAVIAAQQPCLQGVAAAQTTILSQFGRPTPAWIARPGIAVTRHNLVERYQSIWRKPAPQSVLQAVGLIR